MTLIELVKSLPNYQHLSGAEVANGMRQLLEDLQRLAETEGCISAGVAFDILSAINEAEDA